MMTKNDTTTLQIHFLESGLTYCKSGGNPFFAVGEVGKRGQVVEFSADDIEASRDREGRSWLDLVDDPSAQIARWGKHYFGRGPWPDSEPRFKPGTDEWAFAREQARQAAWALPDGPQRAEALAEVTRQYGAAPVTSRTMSTVRSAEDAASRWQQVHEKEEVDE